MLRDWCVRIVLLGAGESRAAPQPLIERLDPVTKARVMMALLGLVILALAVVALVLMGGRFVRRLSKTSRPPHAPRPWYEARRGDQEKDSAEDPERPPGDQEKSA